MTSIYRGSRSERARLAVRVTAEQKRRLEHAAALRGQSVSALVVEGALRAADEAIREHEVWKLSEADSRAFIDALLNPQPPSPRLLQALNRYEEESDPRMP